MSSSRFPQMAAEQLSPTVWSGSESEAGRNPGEDQRQVTTFGRLSGSQLFDDENVDQLWSRNVSEAGTEFSSLVQSG